MRGRFLSAPAKLASQPRDRPDRRVALRALATVFLIAKSAATKPSATEQRAMFSWIASLYVRDDGG